MTTVTARFELQVTTLSATARLPSRAHEGDAGFDLHADESLVLEPGARSLVGTGIAVAIPRGYVGLVCPRSGIAARHGIGVVNGPGVIDSGYRGEVRVVLHNSDTSQPFHVESGDRIAQLVIVAIPEVQLTPVTALEDGERGDAGFGSTGGYRSAPAKSSDAAHTEGSSR